MKKDPHTGGGSRLADLSRTCKGVRRERNKESLGKKRVDYNDKQAQFFLSFMDEDLTIAQLRTLLAEENATHTDSYLKFRSASLQKQLLAQSTSGREIGNLEFRKKGKRTKNEEGFVESPKFLEILAIIKNQPGQVALYSNYFVNGIQRFADFLDRQGMKDQYLLLSPEQNVETQMKIVQHYNEAKKRILLIHPEITEGRSLNGTEQFHILEPISNGSLLDQVIGRAIRYRSHLHLPLERRKVNVYLWESEIHYSNLKIPTSAGLLRREQWQKNYSEINPSMWSKGILELDGNYFLKDETPDLRVKRTRSITLKDLESFQSLLEHYSIEKTLEKI